MKPETRTRLTRYLLITQISIYGFIVLHAVMWYVLRIHVLTKLCPFVFRDQVGRLEFNFTILFWAAVFASTLFLGRAFCAWGCMFGAYQDFVHRLARALKIKPTGRRSGRWGLGFVIALVFTAYILGGNNYWPSLFWFTAVVVIIGLAVWRLLEKGPTASNLRTLPKYVLLAQFLGGIIALWISLNVFQKGVTFVFDKYSVFYNEQWAVQAVFAAMIAAVIGAVEKRPFCRYLCPVGLLLRLASAIPFRKRLMVRASSEECSHCSACDRECPMELHPMEEINAYGNVRNPECINCLRCVSKCPQKALDFKRL